MLSFLTGSKKTVKLLAIQIGSIIGDRDRNIKKVRDFLESLLKAENVDFVFLPEVWTVGWDCPSFNDAAEPLNSSFAITMLKSIAKKLMVMAGAEDSGTHTDHGTAAGNRLSKI